jgi:hypothetical protein
MNDLVPAEEAALARGAGLAPVGRYDKAKSPQFAELCQQAAKGPKYHLDDEIGLIRGYLAKLVTAMDDGESLKPKDLASILSNLRETLKQAAEFEGLVSIERVKSWAAALICIIREEVKDEEIVANISRRAARHSI